MALISGLVLAAGLSPDGRGVAAPAADSQPLERGSGLPGGRAELARGGYSVLPEYRPIVFDGAPQADELGELGIGSPESAARRLKRQARPYRRKGEKRLYPTFELIATIALASPGADGKYRSRQTNKTIRKYLKVAKRHKFLLVLDIQPGRSTFIKEVKHFKRFLDEPNVGIGLDPEWNMGPGGVPGQRIGDVDASQINKVTRFLSDQWIKHKVPEKLVIVHHFNDAMITHKQKIRSPRGVDIVLNADGFGTKQAKINQYQALLPKRKYLHPGIKLFYREDSGLMSPREVMAIRPRPRIVVYE